MATTESELRALLDSRAEAIRAKDLDRLLSFYSPDIVYFDVVPPLQHVGSAALRERFTDWFQGFEGPISQDLTDVTISAGADIAITSMLIRSGGIVRDGPEVVRWLRGTSDFRRSNGRWLVTHEHISVPVDLASGRAAVDLVP